jgi:trk system potassium uptake protein
MKKQIAVIGLGSFGGNVAKTLITIGHDVLAIDSDEKKVQEASSVVTRAVQADATNESVLRELGIGNFDIGIVTISEIEKSVLCTLLLKRLGIRYVMARAESELHEIILKRIGADKVVFPERETGIGMAYVLTLGDIIDYIPVTSGYGVVKMQASNYLVGKTLSDVGFGRSGKWQVIVLLLQQKQDLIVNPSGNETVRAGDVLVLSGAWDRLEELFTEVQTPTEES